jgi:uncharacterized protein YchJ
MPEIVFKGKEYVYSHCGSGRKYKQCHGTN